MHGLEHFVVNRDPGPGDEYQEELIANAHTDERAYNVYPDDDEHEGITHIIIC